MTVEERRQAELRSIEKFTKGTMEQIKEESKEEEKKPEKKATKKQTKGAK